MLGAEIKGDAGLAVAGLRDIERLSPEPKTAYFGTPARPAGEMHRINSALGKLPELLARVRELEAKLLEKTP